MTDEQLKEKLDRVKAEKAERMPDMTPSDQAQDKPQE
jgi:hypothetical protein